MKIFSTLMFFLTFFIFAILIYLSEMFSNKIVSLEKKYISSEEICQEIDKSTERYIIEKSFIINTERETPLFFIVEYNNELVVCKEMVK